MMYSAKHAAKNPNESDGPSTLSFDWRNGVFSQPNRVGIISPHGRDLLAARTILRKALTRITEDVSSEVEESPK